MDKILSVPVRLDHQLCFTLYSTSLAMTKVYRSILKSWELTYPQYLVLRVLWTVDGITVSELGEELFLDSGTLTPLLKRMEAMNLVQRNRSLEDERQVIVSLNKKGLTLKDDLQFLPEKILELSRCSDKDLKTLTTKLHKVRTALIRQQDASIRSH